MFKYTARYSFIIFKVSIIPSARGLVALFLGIVLVSTSTVHGMSMAPMPMKPKKPLCTVAEGKRADEKAQRRALREYENKLIDDLLAFRTDLNTDIGPGGKPLEIVSRVKAIATLLQHGADPKQCQRSTLLRPLFYYVYRTDEAGPDFFRAQQRQCEEHGRRAKKLFKCFDLLLRAGANTDQEMQGRLPLQALLWLERNDYCLHINIDTLLKKLIWHGANPGNMETGSGRNAYGYRMGLNSLHRLNIKQERRKYEAVCQLLKGQKEDGSPFHLLPKPVLKQVIDYIKYGPFVPPAEKKVIPPKIEVAASVSTGMPPKSKEPKKAVPLRPTVSIFRCMPIRVIMASVVVSGIGCWLYKRWQRCRATRKKRQQALRDRYRLIYG